MNAGKRRSEEKFILIRVYPCKSAAKLNQTTQAFFVQCNEAALLVEAARLWVLQVYGHVDARDGFFP